MTRFESCASTMFTEGLATLLASVALDWTAPEGCPSRESVASAIVVGGEVSRDVVATAAVERISEDLWRLQLDTKIDGLENRRQIEAPSCAELADAAALLLGIEASSDPAPTPPAPTPRRAEPLPPEPRPGHAVEAPRRPPSASRSFAIGVAAGLGLGVFTGSATGAVASASWLPGKNRLKVDAAYFGTPQVVVVGVNFDLAAAGVTGCRLLLDGPVQVAPCAGVEGGRIAVRGVPGWVNPSFDDTVPWVALRAGGLVSYPIGRFSVTADVGVLAPLVRHRFVIAEALTIHEVAPVTLRLLAGVELRFP
jgi:hypothetical protein